MAKSKIDKAHLCPVWPAEAMTVRLEKCRVMLSLHGMITDAENEKVKARINKKRLSEKKERQVSDAN